MTSCQALWFWLKCIIILKIPACTIGNVLSIGDDQMSYSDANSYCTSNGLKLLSIHSDATLDEAKDLCDSKSSNGDGCWIGLYQNLATDEWEWTDGSTIDYGFQDGNATVGEYPWNSGEPNNDQDCTSTCNWWEWWIFDCDTECESEQCIHLAAWAELKWNDHKCSTLCYPICRMYFICRLCLSIRKTGYDQYDNIMFRDTTNRISNISSKFCAHDYSISSSYQFSK